MSGRHEETRQRAAPDHCVGGVTNEQSLLICPAFSPQKNQVRPACFGEAADLDPR